MGTDNEITIDRYDDEGCFGVVIERAGQDPFLLECEADRSSKGHAHELARRFNATRYCIVRLVPVGGNELLLHDMKRLQRPIKEGIPF